MKQDFISHRCSGLLAHNKNSFQKVCIRKIIELDYLDIELGRENTWYLSHLTQGEFDDYPWIDEVTEVIYCPFCGEKL